MSIDSTGSTHSTNSANSAHSTNPAHSTSQARSTSAINSAHSASSANSAPAQKRSRYFGLHFDFHAQRSDTELGKLLTRGMIETILDKTQPDFIQCDCKGHPGIASYRTEVGVPAGGFVADPLKLWREATEARGVALLGHYSGVWDYEAVKRQPEWACVDADGRASREATSTFGPYAERRMIPQLKELSDRYKLDGVWIDGDCWGVGLDYSPQAVAAFRAAYRFDGSLPRRPGDPLFAEWQEFNRESFRAYVRKVAAELHRHNPDFQIASNWAFSSFMPEPVAADVDFLSGDLLPEDSFNSARLEARALAAQDRPWDVMAWSFAKVSGEPLASTKSAPQLMQEAAVAIALGGGFQLYLKQRRDASVHMWPLDTMAEVARFCRERQPWCEGAKRVPQVGLLLSRDALYAFGERLFGPWGERLDGLRGALQALLDAGQATDVIMEHAPEAKLADYPLIVIPEWQRLEEGCRARLRAYVQAGGKLLLIGPGPARLFAAELGIGTPAEPRVALKWLHYGGKMAGLETPLIAADTDRRHEAIGSLYEENDPLGPALPAASVVPCSRGAIGVVWFDFGKPYLTKRTSVQRDFLAGLVRRLLPEPAVEVAGTSYADVVLTEQRDRRIVHLINTSGPHGDPNVSVYDELQPIGPLRVTVRVARRPVRARLEPEGKEIAFAFDADAGVLVVSGLIVDVHAMLVLEFS